MTGECVNLAARLADLAGPGELLVSDSIRLAIGSAGRFEDRGEHQLQGIAGAVQVYRLLALGDPEDAGSFVGRGAELAQLTMLLARTERTWRGELVLVRGLIVFANRDRLPPPRPTVAQRQPPAAQPQSTAAPETGRVNTVDVLDKVNDALRK